MSSWPQIVNRFRSMVRQLMSYPRISLTVISLGSSALVLAAWLQISNTNNPPIQETLAIPLATTEDSAWSQPVVDLQWNEQRVAAGDNLSTLFQRSGLSPADVYRISNTEDGQSLLDLYPGELLRFGMDSVGKLREIHYQKSPLESYVFVAANDGYHSEHRLREPEILVGFRQGVIDESLYMSAKQAKLPDKIIMELANIFAWDIDFVFDIRAGDSFALLYEQRFVDGKALSAGNILAASFTNQGKTYSAVRYKDSRGRSSYYTPEGLSMRKAFLRTPLDIFRISSDFNLRRKHPIHKKIKAHRGVDYAAPTGTPVYATGDGKVVEAGYSKANGNYVFIQHGQIYTTKYLHLHSKRVRTGESVDQRQIIGTVGATGYATGPHLHYEFLVNGVHRNPRTVTLPQAKPIPPSEKPAFAASANSLLDQLAAKQSNQLAWNQQLDNRTN